MSDFFDFGRISFTDASDNRSITVDPKDIVEIDPATVGGIACTKLTTRDMDGTISTHYVTETAEQVTKSVRDELGDNSPF